MKGKNVELPIVTLFATKGDPTPTRSVGHGLVFLWRLRLAPPSFATLAMSTTNSLATELIAEVPERGSKVDFERCEANLRVDLGLLLPASGVATFENVQVWTEPKHAWADNTF
ncbi:hypothetical protein PF010_g22032 [Phytophthora fragariae]|uniref:Uncharacterized protein n=2 Tax=Phytophthora fragariae TaxID=53985 RepID=A0A6G0K9K0_9STRA|nr:hypothetical protein PF010_g22032 [Phytophthora fragariae]